MPSDRSGRPDLALLIEFTNTMELGDGTDEFEDPSGLSKWLVARELAERRLDISRAQLARAVAVREGLRALAWQNSAGVADNPALASFQDATRDLIMAPVVGPDGAVRMQPRATGLEGFLAGLLVTINVAMLDGSWSRVKVCRNDKCRWLFFDRSRNRSGTWCDMSVCGNVMKARAYRRRAREK
jgi:predicted RNA-binding Zn ribbon-like protein